MKSTAVTIKEIARSLGISKSTVSRALQNRSDVSFDTRRKVIELAEKLNYQPNAIALNFKNQRTNTIGVIIPETANAFFSRAVDGIQKVANAAGYNVVVCQSNESYVTEKNTLNSLVTNRVDGLLISVSRETEDTGHFESLVERNIPVVFFDRICESLNTSQVFTDNYEISFKATQHLIDEGCRRIVILAGPRHLYTSARRLAGYRDALEKNHVGYEPELLMFPDFRPDNMEEFIVNLIHSKHTPDAIFAINDMAAIEVMHIIKKAGLKIPDDIAVLGFNNEKVGQFVEPSLTSIHLPALEMGSTAAEILLSLIKDPERDVVKKLIPSTLVVRDSTRRPVRRVTALSE